MTFFVSEVVTAVQRQFGDEASVQINEDDVMRWINDAVIEICMQNDLKQATGTMNTVIGTNSYAFPSDLLQVRTIYYDGSRLKFIKRTEYDEYVNEQDPNEELTGTPTLFTRWGSDFILYPKPDAVKQLKLLYLQQPFEVAGVNDDIPVPDIYRARVVEYCLQKAYETDEDWEAAGQMSGQFADGLTRLKEHETVGNVEYYPSITVLPDDSGY